jgi:DNA-binding NtrC family response regulator
MNSGGLFEKFRGIKVLVVDDEKIFHDILRNILDSLGFESCFAFNGEEGVDVFKRESPNMVMTDIYMPRKNGIMMAREIQRLNDRIPVILMTGSLSENSIVFSPDMKVVTVLMKPFKLLDILGAIEKGLRNIDQADYMKIISLDNN